MRLLARVLLDLAARHEVEELLRPADLHIARERKGVVALHEGVQEFVEVDRVAIIEALAKVVASEHLRDRELGHERDDIGEAERAQPLGVVAEFGLRRIEDRCGLVEVALFVGLDVFLRQRRAEFVLVARVTDEGRVVADQEDRVVTELLELAQLSQRDGVTKSQRCGRRVDAQVDAQRPIQGDQGPQFAFHLQLQAVVAVFDATREDAHLLFDGRHLAGRVRTSRFLRPSCFVGHWTASRASTTSRAICAFSSSMLAKALSPRKRCTISSSMRSP